MNSDETGLLHAIYDEPFDVVPRRVYADWLEDQGATGLAALQRMWMPDGSHKDLDQWWQQRKDLQYQVGKEAPEGISLHLGDEGELWALVPSGWKTADTLDLDSLHRWMSRHHVWRLSLAQTIGSLMRWIRHPMVGQLIGLGCSDGLASLFVGLSHTHRFPHVVDLHLDTFRGPLDGLRWLLERGEFPQLRWLTPGGRYSPAEMRRFLRDRAIQKVNRVRLHMGDLENLRDADLNDLCPLPAVRSLVLVDERLRRGRPRAERLIRQVFPGLQSLTLIVPCGQTLSRLPEAMDLEQLRELRVHSCVENAEDQLIHVAEKLPATACFSFCEDEPSPGLIDRLSEMLGPRFRHETYP